MRLSRHEETQQQPVPEHGEAHHGEVGFGECEFAALDAGEELLGDGVVVEEGLPALALQGGVAEVVAVQVVAAEFVRHQRGQRGRQRREERHQDVAVEFVAAVLRQLVVGSEEDGAVEGEAGRAQNVLVPVEALHSVVFDDDIAGLEKSHSLAFVGEDFLPGRGDLVERTHHQIAQQAHQRSLLMFIPPPIAIRIGGVNSNFGAEGHEGVEGGPGGSGEVEFGWIYAGLRLVGDSEV